MKFEEKTLVRLISGIYVARKAPEEVADLDVAFESTYRAVVRQRCRFEEDPRGAGDSGLPFGPASIRRTLINATIWLADQLLQMALKRADTEDSDQRLEQLTKRLGGHAGDSELVEEVDLLVRTVLLLETEAESRPEESASVPSDQGDADLLMLVNTRRRSEELRLVYHVHARDPEAGLVFRPFLSSPIRQDPREHFADLFEEIQNLKEKSPEIAAKKLTACGHRLFDMLLPVELQRAFWSLRDRIRTVQVISEETWIPWELLKLRDPDRAGVTGSFFAEAFALSRWPQGFPITLAFPLRSIALVMPDDGGLPSARAEEAMLKSLKGPCRNVAAVAARYVDVTNALGSEPFDGWHFIGHGVVRGAAPDRWGLALEDYEVLTVSDLLGLARPLDVNRPLVFLNTCHGARSGLSLMDASGLASAFVAAGAGAVIASHWALYDGRGGDFAGLFYRFFLKGLPIGEAVRRARLALRKACPGDPTWLAYSVFAHPLARNGTTSTDGSRG